MYDEVIDDSKPLEIFDPHSVWKRKVLENFIARELMVQVFKNGELCYEYPSMEELRAYCQKEVDSLWEEVKRFDDPHKYYVDMSQKLWNIRHNLLMEAK